jgi:hypothetical protein
MQSHEWKMTPEKRGATSRPVGCARGVRGPARRTGCATQGLCTRGWGARCAGRAGSIWCLIQSVVVQVIDLLVYHIYIYENLIHDAMILHSQ